MGAAYPEVVAERARIEEAVRGEEERFAETLDSGMRRIEEYAAAAAQARAASTASSCSRSTTPTGFRATWPRRSSRTAAGR